MKKNRFIKTLAAILTVMIFCMVSALTVSAADVTTAETAGNVADVVEEVAENALGQVKQIVNNVVFPVIDVILVVALFINAGMLYFNYKKGRDISWTPVILLFAGLLISLTAPLYIWTVVGV